MLRKKTCLILAMVMLPLGLMGADLFGNVTFRGKVIDADTLKPIEGAVVVATWDKCHPGIGEGNHYAISRWPKSP